MRAPTKDVLLYGARGRVGDVPFDAAPVIGLYNGVYFELGKFLDSGEVEGQDYTEAELEGAAQAGELTVFPKLVQAEPGVQAWIVSDPDTGLVEQELSNSSVWYHCIQVRGGSIFCVRRPECDSVRAALYVRHRSAAERALSLGLPESLHHARWAWLTAKPTQPSDVRTLAAAYALSGLVEQGNALLRLAGIQ